MHQVANDLAFASRHLCKALQCNVDLILDYKVPTEHDPGRFRIRAAWLQYGKPVCEVTSIEASKATSIDFQTVLQQHHLCCVQRWKLINAAKKSVKKQEEKKPKKKP